MNPDRCIVAAETFEKLTSLGRLPSGEPPIADVMPAMCAIGIDIVAILAAILR